MEFCTQLSECIKELCQLLVFLWFCFWQSVCLTKKDRVEETLKIWNKMKKKNCVCAQMLGKEPVQCHLQYPKHLCFLKKAYILMICCKKKKRLKKKSVCFVIVSVKRKIEVTFPIGFGLFLSFFVYCFHIRSVEVLINRVVGWTISQAEALWSWLRLIVYYVKHITIRHHGEDSPVRKHALHGGLRAFGSPILVPIRHHSTVTRCSLLLNWLQMKHSHLI